MSGGPFRLAVSSVLAVVSVVAAGLAAQSQTPLNVDQVPVMPTAPAPQFRSRTVLVPVDVRVIDKFGRAVTDLTASDFTVLENDLPQKIEHFAFQRFTPEAGAVESGTPASLPRAANAFEMTSPNRRTFLILLGRGLLQEPSKGIDAMIHLVRDVAMPQDYIAVMAWNRATDFTTDRERLISILERFKKDNIGIENRIRMRDDSLEAIYGDGRPPAGVQAKIDAVFGGPGAAGVRTMDSDSEMAFGADKALRQIAQDLLDPTPTLAPIDAWVARMYGESLDDLLRRGSSEIADLTSLLMGIEHLRVIAGQKQIMFLSEYGFSRPYADEVVMVGRRAADARVTMNFIHAGGMATSTPNIASARDPEELNGGALFDRNLVTAQDARTITKLSGGQFFAHKHGESAQDVDLMDQATQAQYALGFYPANDPIDGKYRRLQVRVSRPGLTVLARDGYYARAQVGPAEMKSAIVLSRVRSAAGRQFLIPDIRVDRLTIAPRPGPPREAAVSMSIDLSRVYFEKKEGLNVANIDIGVFVVTNRNREAGQVWHNQTLSYTDQELEQARRTGLLHQSVVPLTETPQGVKVVVYDYASDLLGSAVARVKK